MQTVAVLGAGSWGTALAVHLSRLKHRVKLWVRRPELCQLIATSRENLTYNPGHRIPEEILVYSDISEVTRDSDVLVIAVPSHTMGRLLESLIECYISEVPVISATKGIENDTLRRMSEVIQQGLPISENRIMVLSGPSFAEEVLMGYPTAIALASSDMRLARSYQQQFSGQNIRLYLNSDVIGTEIGGAVKNIIAIASGVLNGLGFGSNTEAALITRSLAEIRRLALASGGQAATISGLAGLGDLLLTCTGNLSRNRKVGMALGRGEKLEDIVGRMDMIAEGIQTTRSTHALAHQLSVELPIVEQVYAILYGGVSPEDAVRTLMERELKEEEWG